MRMQTVTQTPTTGSALRAPCRPLKVLVAEDDALNQKLMRRILEDGGHRAVLAADGQEALAAYEGEPFDLILMDVQMTGMDGLETAMEIRRQEATNERFTPIVALTAGGMTGDRERCLAAGMDDYITKPLTREKLIELIDGLCEADPGFRPPGEQTPEVRPPGVRPHDPSPLKVFDRRRTLALCNDDPDLAREVVDLLVETAAGLMSALRDALAAADAEVVERQAHALKGAAANVGGERIEGAARRLMEVAAGGDLDAAPAIVAELEEDLARLEQALADFRAELEEGVG